MVRHLDKQRRLGNLPFLLVLGIALSFGSVARAERPQANNIYQWLISMGGIAFDQRGGIFLPTNVIQGLQQGRFSTFSQLLLFTHMINEAVENVLKKAPGRKTPYLQAAEIFEAGLCKLTSAFQQVMTTAILTETNRQLKASTGLTEQQRNEARQQIALAMYQAVQNKRCPGNGNGFDPAIFIVLGGLQQN